jgi:predicted patatin/cPLA2 family phospholipase
VKYALGKHEKTVVVLTRPRGYRKGKQGNTMLLKLVFRKHPGFLQTLLRRNDAYDATLDFCGQMEREGKLFIIAPSPEFSIGRTEKSIEKRVALYNHGYTLMDREFENLQRFLKEDFQV